MVANLQKKVIKKGCITNPIVNYKLKLKGSSLKSSANYLLIFSLSQSYDYKYFIQLSFNCINNIICRCIYQCRCSALLYIMYVIISCRLCIFVVVVVQQLVCEVRNQLLLLSLQTCGICTSPISCSMYICRYQII